MPEDCLLIPLDELFAEGSKAFAVGNPSSVGFAGAGLSSELVSPSSVLCYVFIGGTTQHSKCVVVTHAMALHEVAHYRELLGSGFGSGDRFLQYHSAY